MDRGTDLGTWTYGTGKKPDWDHVNLRTRNALEVDQFTRHPYQNGSDGILS